MGYKCVRCKGYIENLEEVGQVICPHCGFRILIKARPKGETKKVLAR